jgi:uncharacterized CHY-type Zn-finger protein
MALKTQTVILRVRRHIEDASKRRLPRRKTSSELRLLPRYILCTACRNFVSFRGTSCVYSLSELRLLTRYILCTACRNFVSIPRYILCTACRNFVSLRGTSCILIEILNPTGVHSVVHPAEDNKASQPLQ